MEYIFTDEMVVLFDHFSSLVGVRISFFSLDGEELCIGQNRNICSYCNMRKRESAFEQACLDDDRRGREEALAHGGLHFYQCHAGLCEATMPVRTNGYLVGYAMIGQFRLADTMPEATNKRELNALEKVSVFTDEKAEDLLSLFRVLIEHIATKPMVSRRDFDHLGPLIERICNNPAESLTLSQAAKFVGLSPSRVSHLFTSTMGVSFKRFQTERCMELADRLMRAHPDWRISCIAEACGFSDPLYFSRVYRKKRGTPPSRTKLFQEGG